MRTPSLSLLVPLVLAGVAGCGPAGPAARPTPPVTTSPGPSAVPCPSDPEVLAAAKAVNGGLPGGAEVRAGSLVCEAGWAVGALDSEVGPVQILVRLVDGAWKGVVLGSGSLCEVPEMAQVPKTLKARLYCD
ncbi:hypothetical protein AB0M43_02490 [Longispora sp. NPDC051575]|uniref:hypothetical protein n=1 Tax=Longispora sp. NPDC051575 TaxID=3154943 RepID=UPI00342FDECC